MLQFITHPSPRYSIAEEAQMVIEGGCRWIQLRMKEATDEEVREVAMELIPLCKETDTFLIIDDRVDLVNELKVSGVHLGKDDMHPREARELLGPHAVIGATANTAADIMALRGVDIDYIGLGPFRHTTTKERLAPVIGLEGYRSIIEEVRSQGIELPIVAVGGITPDDVEPLMATGVSGIAVSGAILSADNPVECTEEIINRLQNSLK